MKKLIKTSCVFALICISSAIFSDTPYKWAPYGLGFSLPTDWKVKASNNDYFEASDNKEVTMTIKPWKDENIESAEAVAQVAYKAFTNYSNKKILNRKELDQNGSLEKYIMLCEGYSNGHKAMIGIIGIINVDSDVNAYATFIWWDNANTNKNSTKTWKVAQSITSM